VTRYVPLWTQEAEHPATADRRLIGALWPAGRTLGLEVSPQGNGMILNIAPGAAAVPVANGTGSVLCASDSAEQLELDQPGPSGQNRIDLVVINPRADDIGNPGPPGSGDWIFQAIRGDYGAGAPPVPAGTLDLVTVAVNGGGAATILPGAITDRRPGELAVPRTYVPPTPVMFQVNGAANQQINTGANTKLTTSWGAPLINVGGGTWNAGLAAYTVPERALYRVTFQLGWNYVNVIGAGNNVTYLGHIYVNNAARVTGAIYAYLIGAGSTYHCPVSKALILNAGDTVEFYGQNGSTVNQNAIGNPVYTFAEIEKLHVPV